MVLHCRSPEVTNNIPRPNLIPFTEPYAEGGSMHPGTRLKALQGTAVRKHPAIKPTSSTNEGMTGRSICLFLFVNYFKTLPIGVLKLGRVHEGIKIEYLYNLLNSLTKF